VERSGAFQTANQVFTRCLAIIGLGALVSAVETAVNPGEVLAPPEALLTAFADWHHFGLSQEEESLKGAAVKEYRSQLRLSHKLLESFMRTNELLAPV